VLLTGLLGIVLAISAFQLMRLREDDFVRKQVAHDVDDYVRSIQRELDPYLESLDGMAEICTRTVDLDEEAFGDNVRRASRQLSEEWVFHWIPEISHAQRAVFEAETGSAELDQGVRIREVSGDNVLIDAPPRDAYYPIMFCKGRCRGQDQSIGLDVWTDPLRRKALQQARANGRISATRVLNRFRGLRTMVLFEPVYASGSLSADGSNLRGFVSLHMPVSAILDSPYAPRLENLAFEVTDRSSHAESGTLVDIRPNRESDSGLRISRTIKVADHEWVVTGSPDSAFASRHRTWTPIGALLSVLLATVLIVTALTFLSNRTAQVQSVVQQRTRDLFQAYADLEHEMRDRESAEQRAMQHQEDLAHLMRRHTLEEMASGLAHELNQPLTAIGNYAAGCQQRVQAGKFTEADIAATMGEISAQANRAGEIIRRLRNLIRKRRPERQAADLNELITDLTQLAEIEAQRNSATIEVIPAPTPVMVFVDGIQIQQVVLNLVRNAVEAMRNAESDPRKVTVTIEQNAAGARVTVSDNGPGLAAELHEHLFDPFFTTKTEGMGMGLAISRSIIEAHDGRLWAAAAGENGATFHFELPGLA
jgi:signal transduction histidine kinase